MSLREREVWLAVDHDFMMPDLDGALTAAHPGPPSERTYCDLYFDTDDLRLARWRCSVRFRSDHGWTVELPATGIDAGETSRPTTLVRNEVCVRGPAGDPPQATLDLVGSFSRGAPVAPVEKLTTRRIARVWCSDAGEPLLEVAEDRVRAEPIPGRRGCGETTSFRQVKVGLAPDAEPSLLDGIVKQLTKSGARVDPAGLEMARALGTAALAPPDVVPAPMGPDPTARDIIRAAITRSVIQLITWIPAVLVGEDSEGVHQARVATRRLRSDLRTFKPFLDPVWSAPLHDQLRSLAAVFGGVRDADVLLARLQDTIEGHREIDPDAASGVLGALEADRDDARNRLTATLGDDSTYQLLDALVAAAADPATTGNADRRARRRLAKLVDKRWRALSREVEALGADPPVAALHEVRILAKRARYAAEAVTPAFGSAPRSFTRAMARIQDVLGNLNDVAVAEAWLSEASNRLDGEASFAAGRMAQIMSADADRYHHGWEKAYRKAARRRNRAWFS